jgi:hypothetical protein
MKVDAKLVEPTDEEVISAETLAKKLDISEARLWQAVRSGDIRQPTYKVGLRSPRWFWSEVRADLSADREKPQDRKSTNVQRGKARKALAGES